MNDLPDDQKSQQSSSGSLSKEKEKLGGGVEAPALREFGKEEELPPEVRDAGVQMHPTTVPLPKPVQNLGVQQVGQTSQQPPAVTLPLTDDQIAQGLHQSILSSWRWLAEWCLRKLKQIKRIIKK